MRRLFSTLFLFLSAPSAALCQSTLAAGPVPYVNAGFSSPVDLVNQGISNVNKYLQANPSSVTFPVTLAQGGTGATTQAGAQTNLGLGTMATQSAGAVAITGGTANLSFLGFNNSATVSGSNPLQLTPQVSTQTWNGTYTGTGNPIWLNRYVSTSDSISAGSNGAELENLYMYVGGSTATGPRTTFNCKMQQTSTTGNSNASQAAYVCASFLASMLANDGGTGLTPSTVSGAMTASNPVVSWGANATYTSGGSGEEIDVGATTGSSMLTKNGLNIVLLSYDRVQGTGDDAGLVFGSQSTNVPGWKTGIEFGSKYADFPVSSTGTLITGQQLGGTQFNVGYGIDWLLGNAASYWLRFGSGGSSIFSVDGSGDLVANGTGQFNSTLYVGSTLSIGSAVGAGGTSNIYTPNGSNINLSPGGTAYVDVNADLIMAGSQPTISGTCTTKTAIGGGQMAGSMGLTCAAQTVILTFTSTAPHGYKCNMNDVTNPSDTMLQTAVSSTSCTMTGTTGTSDLVLYSAQGY